MTSRIVAGTVASVLLVAGLVTGVAPAVADPTYDPSQPVAPVLSYTFDSDTGTTAVDSSGNGRDGTLVAPTGSVPSHTTGVSGSALAISAGTKYVKLPLVAGKTDASSSFSYEFWLDETARTSYGTLMSNQDFAHCYDAGLTLYNRTTAGALQACWGEPAGTTARYLPSSSAGLTPNVLGGWHHVGVVVDRSASTITVYVDGVKAGQSASGTLATTTNLKSGLAFNLGGLSGSEADTADGYTTAAVDDLNFYDAAISASQVAADYAATNPATHQPITVTSAGHGTGSSTPLNAAAGSTVTLTATPDAGYHLSSWTPVSPSDLAVGGDGTFTMPSGSTPVTVEAQFAANAYTVHFDGNGATGGATADEHLTYGDAQALTANGFSRTGYRFAGWATSADGASAYDDGQSVTNLTAEDGATVTLHAVWVADDSHAVTVTGDAHVSVTSSATSGFASAGDTVTLGAKPDTGYHATWSSADVTVGDDGSFTMPDHDVTVKATSTPNHYTVAFDGNDASEGQMDPQTFAYDTPAKLTANGFSRVGDALQGWATSADGPVVYTDGQSVSNLSSTDGATVTLYAVWGTLRASGDTVAPSVMYDFDDDDDTSVTDGSGNGHDGTWHGTAAYATGVDGDAARVSAGTSYVTLPHVEGVTDGSGSFSFSTWWGETAATADPPLVSNQNYDSCTNAGLSLFNPTGTSQQGLCWGTTVGGTKVKPTVSSTSLNGQWHYLTTVVDRSKQTVSYYLDGALAYTSTSGQVTASTSFDSGLPFTIGEDGSGDYVVSYGGTVDALVDDFDFYDQAIPADQVARDYAATKPSSTTVSTPSTGTQVEAGFLTDTFHAPTVRVDGDVSQPVAGLWGGGTPTSFTKVDGDSWLSVDDDGIVTGTAPSTAPDDPGEITVEAKDGDTTSQITVEVPVVGRRTAPQVAAVTWNLWDAGSHVDDSLEKDLTVVATNGLSVIGVQEDGDDTAKRLADALGWHVFEGGQGLGIVSAYPLSSTVDATQASPAAAATADVLGTPVRVWDAALDETDYGPEQACLKGVTDPASLVAHEKTTTRYAQAQAIAKALAGDVATASATPVVFLGDLASPSGADWTDATSSDHCGVGSVDWPAVSAVLGAGLTDTYRVANPDPATDAGDTWSPFVKTNGSDDEPQDRIDYVASAGDGLKVLGSNTLVAGWPSATNVSGGAWTSDHAAVVTTFTVGDGTPSVGPAVSATVDPSAPDGQDDWYVTAPTLTATASDDDGGTPTVQYRVDGDDWTTYTGPLVASQGDHVYDLQAVTDTATSAIQEQSLKVDSVAPTTSLASVKADHALTVTLAATDATSGVARTEYRVVTGDDEGGWTTYDGPVTVSASSSQQTLEYRSVDVAGNTETPGQLVVEASSDDGGSTTPVGVAAETAPITYGSYGHVKVTLFGASAGGTVTVSGVDKTQTRTIPVGTSDERVTTFSVRATQKPGSYPETVTFVPASGSTLMTREQVGIVKRASAAKLTVSTRPTTHHTGKAVLHLARLTGLAWVDGRTTVILRKGRTVRTAWVTASRDVAHVTLPKLARGTWKVSVTYRGNAYYKVTTTRQASLKVK